MPVKEEREVNAMYKPSTLTLGRSQPNTSHNMITNSLISSYLKLSLYFKSYLVIFSSGTPSCYVGWLEWKATEISLNISSPFVYFSLHISYFPGYQSHTNSINFKQNLP